MQSLQNLRKKSQEIVDKNLAAFDDGHSLVMEKLGDVEIDTLPAPGKKDQMFLLGNEACALGAIAAGSRFMASYPITPASEVMEYMLKLWISWAQLLFKQKMKSQLV